MNKVCLQKIDKELKTALDALEKEKASALKDLDSQVCTLFWNGNLVMHAQAPPPSSDCTRCKPIR